MIGGGVLDLVQSKAKCPGARHKDNKINDRNSSSMDGWKGGNFFAARLGKRQP